jgi:hypothetical protein
MFQQMGCSAFHVLNSNISLYLAFISTMYQPHQLCEEFQYFFALNGIKISGLNALD